MRRNKGVAILSETESIRPDLLGALEDPTPVRQHVGIDRVDDHPPNYDRARGQWRGHASVHMVSTGSSIHDIYKERSATQAVELDVVELCRARISLCRKGRDGRLGPTWCQRYNLALAIWST